MDADTPSTADAAEFVELYGTPNQSLDGYVLVFYNGNGDVSYAAFDLDGYSLSSEGLPPGLDEIQTLPRQQTGFSQEPKHLRLEQLSDLVRIPDEKRRKPAIL